MAVVAELATQPAEAICNNLVFAIPPANIAFVTLLAQIVVTLPAEHISPVKAGIVVTVLALPLRVAVIVPAQKLLLASRATIALAVFKFVAVVAALVTQPAEAICNNLVFAIEPANIAFVTTPGVIVVVRLLVPVEVTWPVKGGIHVIVVAFPLKSNREPVSEPITITEPEIFTVFEKKSPFISGVPEPEAIYNLLFSSVFAEGPAPNPIAILFEELPEKNNPAFSPKAILLDPDVLVCKIPHPIAVLLVPVELFSKVYLPIAVL